MLIKKRRRTLTRPRPLSKSCGPIEKDIERGILNYLSLIPNIVVWKQNTVGIYDQKTGRYRLPHSPYIRKGISDILGIIRAGASGFGRFLALEVKTPKRHKCLSDDQKNFITMINNMGGLAFVATSIEEVKWVLIKEGIIPGES
jgi:hypothetical protein